MNYQVGLWQRHRWERQDGRYYCALIEQDILGDWVIRRYWGGSKKPAGQMLISPCSNYKNAIEQLLLISKVRDNRKYSLV